MPTNAHRRSLIAATAIAPRPIPGTEMDTLRRQAGLPHSNKFIKPGWHRDAITGFIVRDEHESRSGKGLGYVTRRAPVETSYKSGGRGR